MRRRSLLPVFFYSGLCDEMIPLNDLEKHKEICSGQAKSVKSLMGREMKDMLSQSKNGMIKVPTGGQVSN